MHRRVARGEPQRHAAAPAPCARRALVAALGLSVGLAGCSHASQGPGSAAAGGGTVATAAAASSSAAPQLIAGRWLAGGSFTELHHERPAALPTGRVQVVEVFWYGCPHCDAFEPYLEQWLKTKPAYIDFQRVPVMWSDIHRAHAQLFYTLQQLGQVDRLHQSIFEAIQHRGDPLFVAGNPRATFADQLKFAQANGIDAAAFTRAYQSSAVQAALRAAIALEQRDRVDAVPSMIVDDRYESDPSLVGSNQNLLQWTDDMAALEERQAVR